MQEKDARILGTGDSLDVLVNDGLQSQDSFGKWINDIIADSAGSVDNALVESSISSSHDSHTSPAIDQLQSSVPEQIFVITDISHTWAFSAEMTKVFCFLLPSVSILGCLLCQC